MPAAWPATVSPTAAITVGPNGRPTIIQPSTTTVWRARYPGFGSVFVPGAFGKNISTIGLTESDLCVGDVFRFGGATLQLVQPRQPCWKVGARTRGAGLGRTLATEGRAGGFYRALEPGEIAPGDALAGVERASHGITLARLWTLNNRRDRFGGCRGTGVSRRLPGSGGRVSPAPGSAPRATNESAASGARRMRRRTVRARRWIAPDGTRRGNIAPIREYAIRAVVLGPNGITQTHESPVNSARLSERHTRGLG